MTINPGAETVEISLFQNFGQFIHDAIYGPADVFGNDGTRIFYRQFTGATSSQSLALIVPGPGASGLDYASYGIWETRALSFFGTDIQGGALSYGILTERSAVPVAGSASYDGFVNGFFANAGGTGFYLDGTAALDVNFSSRTLTGLFTNIMASSFFGIVGGSSFSDIQANANISGNGFTGTVQTLATPAVVINPAMNGQIDGNFFGPTAEEIGGVFRMTGADGSSTVGGFAAGQ